MTKTKPTLISATEMQKKSGQLLKRCHLKHEHFIVTREGYPVVAIIPVDEYERWQSSEK